MFSGLKKTVIGATAALAAAGALALSATAVSAVPLHPQGTDGQQIVLNHPAVQSGYAKIHGWNQTDEYGNRHKVDKKVQLKSNANYTKLSAWWWVGPVTIEWFFNGSYAGTTDDCNVTMNQGDAHEFQCAYHQ
ncbi:MAG: hypothetical protein ACR2JX_00025 [Mycobacteriales bacterium]